MVRVLRPGELLAGGRYKCGAEVNRGATAVVYAATDMHADHGQAQQVALKVINTSQHTGKMLVPVRVVKREIELAGKLRRHPNVVRLLDVFAEDKTQLVLVWELVKGPDLLDLVNELGGKLSEEAAFGYFRQLVAGLSFLHGEGICHRDLKPENCVVERSTGTLKIIDFGLSKHDGSARTLGIGTPDYQAPELITSARTAGGGAPGGQAPYSGRAVDIWALGVMLYLMVGGTYPFEDPNKPDDMAATLRNVVKGKYRPLSGVSMGCRALVIALLTPDPAKRITLEGVQRHRWFLANKATASAPRALAPPPRPRTLGGGGGGSPGNAAVSVPGAVSMDDLAVGPGGSGLGGEGEGEGEGGSAESLAKSWAAGEHRPPGLGAGPSAPGEGPSGGGRPKGPTGDGRPKGTTGRVTAWAVKRPGAVKRLLPNRHSS